MRWKEKCWEKRAGKPREGMITDLKKELEHTWCDEIKRKDDGKELKDLKKKFGKKWFGEMKRKAEDREGWRRWMPVSGCQGPSGDAAVQDAASL